MKLKIKQEVETEIDILLPVYKYFAGWVKIISPNEYVFIQHDYSRIEEVKDNHITTSLFLFKGAESTEHDFIDAFATALLRFTNTLSNISRQRFIDSGKSEPATSIETEHKINQDADDDLHDEEMTYNNTATIFEKNAERSSTVNSLNRIS